MGVLKLLKHEMHRNKEGYLFVLSLLPWGMQNVDIFVEVITLMPYKNASFCKAGYT